jgi:hypothetical protein
MSSRDVDRRHKFIVSDKHRFIFYEIQKCATETMRRYFLGTTRKNTTRNIYGARRISGGRSKALQFEKDGYYRFTFVRNPWARTVSAWESKFQQYYDPRHPTLPGIRDSRLSLDTTFGEYVRFISEIPDSIADCHFKSMHTFVDVCNTFIGRVERMDEDFDIIRTYLELPLLDIPRENVTKKKVPWREYYTDELRGLVAQRYKRDIDLFNYTF